MMVLRNFGGDEWTDEQQEKQSKVSDAEILLFAAWFAEEMNARWLGLLNAQLLGEAEPGARFRWDEGQGEYVNYRSRVIRGVQVRSALDALVRSSRVEMRTLSQELIAGRTTLAKWRWQMSLSIKRLQTLEAVGARGGWDQMSNADWLDLGRRIKAQYRYLRGFAQDIASGRQPLDGRLLRRADLYAQAGRTAFENARRRFMQIYRGATHERRVLGLADHCTTQGFLLGCPELAAKGWQPIGTLPELGESPCIVLCKCHFEYRKNED